MRVEKSRAVESMHSPSCEAVTGYSAEGFAADPYLYIKMVSPEYYACLDAANWEHKSTRNVLYLTTLSD
ncbi:MAG: hypothetical protein D5R98_04410 [Desulfonatronovibrio sp. MSAO_Bac4]|nr:MAG: hypothetical protein D5R98_04410 [Desulfonatronovibrio sp. MSAO_Bac4]